MYYKSNILNKNIIHSRSKEIKMENVMKFMSHSRSLRGGPEDGQSGKCLPYKHEDLNVHLQDLHRKLGTMMHFCNHSAEEVETGRFTELAESQSSQSVSFIFIKRPFLKK